MSSSKKQLKPFFLFTSIFLVFFCQAQDSTAFLKYMNKGDQLLIKTNNAKKSLKWYKKAQKKDLTSFTEHFFRGKKQYLNGELEQAVESFNQAIALQKDYPQTYYERSLAYFDQQLFKEALADITFYLDARKNDAFAYNLSGNINCQLKKYLASETDFNAAISIRKEQSTFFNNRGVLYREMSKTNWAVADFHKAIRLDSNYTLAYYNLGRLQISNLKQYQEGISNLNKAIDKGLEQKEAFYLADAHYNIAHALYHSKEYENAIPYYKMAIESNTFSDSLKAQLFFGKGSANAYLGNLDLALKDFDQALSLDSMIMGVRTNKALLVHDAKGEYELAIQAMKQEIRMRAKQQNARQNPYDFNNLGYLYYKNGENEKALELVFKSIAMDPNNAFAYRNIALVFMALGNKSDACDYANRAISLGFEKLYGNEILDIKKNACGE